MYFRREKADSVWHSKLHRAGDPHEERALVRGGHLESGLYYVHATRRQAALRDLLAQGHLQEDQAM